MTLTRQNILLLLAVVAGAITTITGFAEWNHFWGWAALTATLYLASRVS